MRNVTDPFLFSGNDDESPARPVNPNDALARRSGLPPAIFDIVPAEVIEDFVRASPRSRRQQPRAVRRRRLAGHCRGGGGLYSHPWPARRRYARQHREQCQQPV